MKKISSFLIILVIFALGTFFIINNFIKGSLKAAETGNGIRITVEIPSGSTTDDIAKILSDKGLIKSPLAFKYYAKKTEFDKKLRAGNFVLTKSMDADEILKVLTKGGSNENTQNITIVEGLTLEDTAKAISEQTNLDYEKLDGFMKNVSYFRNDYQFLKDNPTIGNLQGYLMPDTYNVYKDASEEDIVRLLLTQFDKYYLEKIKPELKNTELSFEEVINLSSIVEKEALLNDERDEVAAVFLNRLKINMKLQSCATVNYARGDWKESLTLEDIEIDSPYNTYKIEGLPPGPINSPGRVSIQAVLNPAKVDYIYFVAKGDGSHHFSTTYEDHLAAKERYSK